MGSGGGARPVGIGALLGLLLLSGCASEEDGASVDVVVSDVEPGLAADVDRIEVSMAPVGGAGSDRPDVHVFEPQRQGLRLRPVAVRFRPFEAGDVGSRLYAFRAVGFRDGAAYVTAQQRMVFVRAVRLTLPIRLYPVCAGVECPDDRTCDETGACVDAFVPACSLEGARPVDCDDVPDDAGAAVDRDAGPDLGALPDAGPPPDLGPPSPDATPPDATPRDAGPPPDAGPPVDCAGDGDCDDGIECTLDRCVGGACVVTPDDARCDDGAACTTDRCGALGCEHAPDDVTCDDADPCTDDRCGALGCEHAPNFAACDDGVFCNGADTCAAGACGVHAGDPCPGATLCQETAGTCVGCVTSADCPARIEGPWSGCGGFASECATGGTETHDVTTFACVGGTCVRSDVTEPRACTRATDGRGCTDDGNGCTADTCAGGVCTHAPRTGSTCSGGYCNGAGACVECLTVEHCRDGDRCTTDRCGAAGRCEHDAAMTSVSVQTQWGHDGFCSNLGTMGYQRVEAGCFNNSGELELSRGYVSFDLRATPSTGQVVSARVHGCRTGGPGGELATLHASGGFPIPLDCGAAYATSAGALQATLPAGEGPFEVSVMPASVTLDAWTQYQVRHPVTACDVGTWNAKRFTSSTGPGGDLCPDSTPWVLDVTYCTAPF